MTAAAAGDMVYVEVRCETLNFSDRISHLVEWSRLVASTFTLQGVPERVSTSGSGTLFLFTGSDTRFRPDWASADGVPEEKSILVLQRDSTEGSALGAPERDRSGMDGLPDHAGHFSSIDGGGGDGAAGA